MVHLNSDSDLTMFAEKIFDEVIDKVKHSKLNYKIQLSPFSAYISLKRSLQKDRTEVTVMSSLDCDAIDKLTSENKTPQRVKGNPS